MRWPWSKRDTPAVPAPTALSISDPTLAALFSMGAGIDIGGINVGEGTALSLSAFYRAVSVIASSLASLPLNTYRRTPAGREQVTSVFDDPDPDGQTPYEWKNTLFTHLLVHGRAYAVKVRNGAGTLAALPLIHPGLVSDVLPTPDQVRNGELPAGGVWFDTDALAPFATSERRRYDANDILYIPGLSLDGKTGVSLLTYARLSLATAVSSDRAAGNMLANGALVAGLVTPDDDEDIQDDVPAIRQQLDRAVHGHENAGRLAIVARRLKLQQLSMSAVDAQFLQQRQFAIEEISRWTGVPPHLLMQTEKQTSWGTGVDEQNRALGRTVLNGWANTLEQRGNRCLKQSTRFLKFDFTEFERPAPDREVDTDLKQVAAGVMTIEEYRHKRGWGPLPAATGGGQDVPPAG